MTAIRELSARSFRSISCSRAARTPLSVRSTFRPFFCSRGISLWAAKKTASSSSPRWPMLVRRVSWTEPESQQQKFSKDSVDTGRLQHGHGVNGHSATLDSKGYGAPRIGAPLQFNHLPRFESADGVVEHVACHSIPKSPRDFQLRLQYLPHLYFH